MARTLLFPLTALNVTNDSTQDIFEITAGAANPFELLAFELYSNYTGAGEPVDLRLVSRSTSGNGSAITPIVTKGGGAAAAVGESLCTTQGSIVASYEPFQWPQLGPLIYRPTPEELDEFAASGRIGLALGTAVASTRVWNGFVKIKEYG